MRWIVDTSAWSRLNRPEVKRQLEELLAGEEDELVLSPAVELEILREPQWGAVAARRQELEEAMEVLAADAETFSLAADAMERLAQQHASASSIGSSCTSCRSRTPRRSWRSWSRRRANASSARRPPDARRPTRPC